MDGLNRCRAFLDAGGISIGGWVLPSKLKGPIVVSKGNHATAKFDLFSWEVLTDPVSYPSRAAHLLLSKHLMTLPF